MEKIARIPVLSKMGVALGLILLILSLLPLDSWHAQQLWTSENAVQYNLLTLKYHESAYQTPARAGLSEAELQARHKQLQDAYEAMRRKLEISQTRPHLWKQVLRWSGLLLMLLGGVMYQK